MKRSSRPRAVAELSESVNHQLNMYALAAGTTGVGLLALASPADAKIVYTPAHEVVRFLLPLDLNHDGTVDFTLYRGYGEGGNFQFLDVCQTVRVNTLSSGFSCYGSTNMVREKRGVRQRAAAALPRGAKIQTGNLFYANRLRLGYHCTCGSGGTFWYGPWVNDGKGVKHRYLGLKFKVKGKFHFGWARLTVEVPHFYNFTATLTGYAYETIPGKAIIAGQTKGPNVTTVDPVSLGHLAAGASAIPAWRLGR